MKKSRFVLLGLFLVFLFLFNYFNLGRFFSLATFKDYQLILETTYQHSPLQFITLFGVLYMILMAISFPSVLIFTLVGGAIFGAPIASLIIIIFGSTGATIAMLLSRYIFRDFIELKFNKWVKLFNSLMCNNPFFTICAIPFIPIFPFFGVNLLAGLTHLSPLQFFLGTLLGMLPSTYLYAAAGLHLSQITHVTEILTLKMFMLLSCLGLISTMALVLKKRLL